MSSTHKHHIIPKHMGGTDDPDNLVELTVEEHQQAHLDLYNIYGKTEDLCAYYMLSGNIEEFRSVYGKLGRESQMRTAAELGCSTFDLISPEGQQNIRETARQMGKKYGPIQGQINKESGWMSELGKSMDPETRKIIGKKGGDVCKALGKGAFCDPELHAISVSKGGKVQGDRKSTRLNSSHSAKSRMPSSA